MLIFTNITKWCLIFSSALSMLSIISSVWWLSLLNRKSTMKRVSKILISLFIPYQKKPQNDVDNFCSLWQAVRYPCSGICQVNNYALQHVFSSTTLCNMRQLLVKHVVRGMIRLLNVNVCYLCKVNSWSMISFVTDLVSSTTIFTHSK